MKVGWVGASIPGLLVTAYHTKGRRSPGPAEGIDATPPAPTAGMWLASDEGGREGDLSRLATGRGRHQGGQGQEPEGRR